MKTQDILTILDKELKLNTMGEIPKTTRGIVYICDYNYDTKRLHVRASILFDDAGDALCAYSEIPNPASQVAYGETWEKFESELSALHDRMRNPEWQRELGEYL